MSRSRDYEPRYMDSSVFRSAIYPRVHDHDPRHALIGTRTAPITVDRRHGDYFSLDRDDLHRSSYGVQSPLDCAIYNSPSVLTNADHIHTRNIQVQLANATITTLTPYAELHPKLTPQGRYPVYLRMPVIVGDLLTVDELRLERILLEYNVPVVGSKKAQICALLDYLGAGRLASAWRRPMTLGVGRR